MGRQLAIVEAKDEAEVRAVGGGSQCPNAYTLSSAIQLASLDPNLESW